MVEAYTSWMNKWRKKTTEDLSTVCWQLFFALTRAYQALYVAATSTSLRPYPSHLCHINSSLLHLCSVLIGLVTQEVEKGDRDRATKKETNLGE